VALRRRETELSLERPVGPDGPPGGVVRLTVKFEPDSSGTGPSPRELTVALDQLKADLDALLGLPMAGLPSQQPERSLLELIDTYRPRQRELVELLKEEGEITPGEYGRLTEYLNGILGTSPRPPAAPASSPTFDQPIAAVPIAAGVAPASERRSESARPVDELLQQYQITSLKQAGAVRARRQISFEEYMALKRHFEPAASAAAEKRS